MGDESMVLFRVKTAAHDVGVSIVAGTQAGLKQAHSRAPSAFTAASFRVPRHYLALLMVPGPARRLLAWHAGEIERAEPRCRR